MTNVNSTISVKLNVNGRTIHSKENIRQDNKIRSNNGLPIGDILQIQSWKWIQSKRKGNFINIPQVPMTVLMSETNTSKQNKTKITRYRETFNNNKRVKLSGKW